MGRGNGENITANAMIRTSRPKNVTETNQYPAFVAYRRSTHIPICYFRFWAINLPAWGAHLGLSPPPLRTGTPTPALKPSISHVNTKPTPTPWQAFKIALIVTSKTM